MPSDKIIIHGVHRSGTSLTANLIEQMGAWYASPAQRMPPRPDNPKGFWERLDVVDINNDILHKLGISWNSIQPPLPAPEIEQLGYAFANRISTVLADLEEHPVSFLKEPRFAFTWPIWQPLMSGNLYHIVVTRHPMMVARSLQKRNNVPLPVGLTFWTHQTIAIQRALQGESHVCHVIFDTSENGITNMVDRITDFVEENKIPLLNYSKEHLCGLFDKKMPQSDVEHISLPKGFKPTADLWQKISADRHTELDLDTLICPASLDWALLESKSSSSILVAERKAHYKQQETQYEQQIESLKAQLSEQMKQLTDQSVQSQRNYIDILGCIDSYQHSTGYKISNQLLSLTTFFRKPSPSSLDYITSLIGKELDLSREKRSLVKNNEAKKLLTAIRNNPILFLRKLSISRIKAGFRILTGNKPSSLNMDQVLSNYATIPIRLQLKKSLIAGPVAIEEINFPISDAPDISIVIPVYNQFQTTLNA